jgi:hypothetical protein
MKKTATAIQFILHLLIAVLLFLLFLNVHFESDLIEVLIIELGIIGWDIAPYIVRGLVGLAWGASLLLLFSNHFSRNIASIVSLFSLVIGLFITYQIFGSNKDYCDNSVFLYLNSPKQTLLFLIGIFVFGMISLFFKSDFSLFSKKASAIVLVVILLLTGILSFAFNPLYIETKVVNDAHKLPVELLYQTNLKPDTDLTKGKFILAFMSYSCKYCQIAAKKFRILQKLNKDIPLYMVVGGLAENEVPFFSNTCSESISHFKISEEHNDAFWKLSGARIPAIYLIDNTKIYKQIHYSALNKKEIEN